MCWRMKSSSRPEKKVAKNDIKVFKVVHHHPSKECYAYFVSIYAKYPYLIGVEYHLDGKLEVESNYDPLEGIFRTEIHKGFHSYSMKMGLYDCDYYVACLSVAHRHTASHYIPDMMQNLAIIECVIPKGAVYYYNPKYGEYVSNAISVVGEGNIEDYLIQTK